MALSDEALPDHRSEHSVSGGTGTTAAPAPVARNPASHGPSVVASSGVVYALQFAAASAWGAYVTVFLRDLGIDLPLMGLLMSVTVAVGIAATPVWGWLADRTGRTRLLYLGAALFAAASATAMIVLRSLPWSVIALLGVAVAWSGLGPMLDARTLQRLGRRRDRFGQARAWGSAASFTMPAIASAFVAAGGPWAAAWIFVIATAAAGIAAWLLLGRGDEGLQVAGVGPLAAVRLLARPSFGLFFVASVIVWVGANSSMAFYSLRLVDLAGGPAVVGVGWVLNGILEIPAMLAFSRLNRQWPGGRLLVIGAVIIAARSALWALVDSPVVFLALAPLGGIGFALLLVGTATYVATRVPSRMLATSQALFSATAYSIGSIAGFALAGQVAAGGLSAIYPISAAIGLVGAALIGLALRSPGGDVSGATVSSR